MTVLCANCHTANRDRAMFCIGCAGKLPAFAATGPSALQAQGASAAAAKAEQRTAAASEGRTAALANAPRGLVLAVLGLGAIVLALTAWISFGPARSPAPGIASAASTVPATASPAVSSAAPTTVPANTTLSPGESMVVAPSASTAPPTAATLPPIFSERIDPGASPVHSAAPPSNAPSQRVASVNANRPAQRSAGDPRAGCEHLFFALAARCEANHCNEAAYARHPRCAIVKEQRLRDEARRNLPN